MSGEEGEKSGGGRPRHGDGRTRRGGKCDLMEIEIGNQGTKGGRYSSTPRLQAPVFSSPKLY